jgi:hypothetical protein
VHKMNPNYPIKKQFGTHTATRHPMTVTMKTPATLARPSSATPPSPPPPAQAPGIKYNVGPY